MPRFTHRSRMPVSAQTLFEWHARDGAFERLAPPWQNIRVLEKEGTITDGSRLRIQLKQGPLPIEMEARHRDYIEGRQFVDELVKSPFRKWEHTHRFLPDGEGQSILDDTFEYQLPLHPVSQWVGGWFAGQQFRRMFRFRHVRTFNDLIRHQKYEDHPRQTVAITGASGLIGRNLCAFLTTGGHTVKRLVRRPAKAADEVYWNPETGEVDIEGLAGVDTVIHLAGENIAGGRWSERRKAAIRKSRIAGTRILSEALARMPNPPQTLLSASAVGFYGDRPADEILTEESAAGEGFLADVVKGWEAATAPAEEAGLRVVHMRIGIVLALQGGAIQKMLFPFLMGAGGRLGSGQQIMSWVSLEDVVGAFYHAMFDATLAGSVNVTAPQPVTNAKFTGTFGRVLRRPTIFPLPAFVLRLLFGEMGEETLLSGAYVQPERLLNSGFEFLYPELADALRYETGRLKPDARMLNSDGSPGISSNKNELIA